MTHLYPSVLSQKRFSQDMFEYILSRVSGTHDNDEIISVRPSRRFIIGTLAARKEGSTSLTEEEGKSSIRAQRLKVSVLVKVRVVEA